MQACYNILRQVQYADDHNVITCVNVIVILNIDIMHNDVYITLIEYNAMVGLYPCRWAHLPSSEMPCEGDPMTAD